MVRQPALELSFVPFVVGCVAELAMFANARAAVFRAKLCNKLEIKTYELW